jgi:hypothetical protein
VGTYKDRQFRLCCASFIWPADPNLPVCLLASALLHTSATGKWVLIDFGLARKYLNDDGSHMEPRPEASFRGSTAYASVHAHRDEDLSRRDDLWSWFYMLLELVEGEAARQPVLALP